MILIEFPFSIRNLFRVGGQTTCKNFFWWGVYGHRMWTNERLLFLCLFFVSVKEGEMLLKMTSSITRHLFWTYIHSCCCDTKEGEGVSPPPRFSFPPHNLVFLFCLKKPSKFFVERLRFGWFLFGLLWRRIRSTGNDYWTTFFFIVCVKLLSLLIFLSTGFFYMYFCRQSRNSINLHTPRRALKRNLPLFKIF